VGADADAGYVVHRDGRMVGVGEYQYGFDKVDELLLASHTDEVQGYARQEAGRIAGCLDPIYLDAVDNGSDDYSLKEMIANAFQADSEVAEAAIKAGKVSFVEMFDLLSNMPGKQVIRGQTSNSDNIKLTTDLVVSRLALTENGKLAWEQRVAIKAGENVDGSAYSSNSSASVSVEGGHVCISQDMFEAVPLPLTQDFLSGKA
jgi:hypothetical protein